MLGSKLDYAGCVGSPDSDPLQCSLPDTHSCRTFARGHYLLATNVSAARRGQGDCCIERTRVILTEGSSVELTWDRFGWAIRGLCTALRTAPVAGCDV